MSSNEDQRQFAMIANAPDHLFLKYIRHYLEQGGKNLKTLCSLSSVMNQRCNTHRLTIMAIRDSILERHFLLMTPEQLEDQYYEAIADNNLNRLNIVLKVGAEPLLQKLTQNNNEGILRSWIPNKRIVSFSVPILQRIFELMDYQDVPTRYLFHFLNGLNNSKERSVAKYILSLPGVRDRLWNMDDPYPYQSIARSQIRKLESGYFDQMM